MCDGNIACMCSVKSVEKRLWSQKMKGKKKKMKEKKIEIQPNHATVITMCLQCTLEQVNNVNKLPERAIDFLIGV